MTASAKRATVITDASFCHNTKAGGFGAWITMDSEQTQPLRIRKGGRLQGFPANPAHAELLAAMNGIWVAFFYGAREILLQTDNMEVVNVINAKAGVGSNLLRIQYADACYNHFMGARIRARHVKGHTTTQDARSFVNRWCDEQAGIHMREVRKERDPSFNANKQVRFEKANRKKKHGSN